MLTIDEIREKVTPVAKEFDLREVYLFGSYARGEANEDSDVDLLVDTPTVYGLIAKERLRDALENSLFLQVDLVLMNCFQENITVGRKFWNDQREQFKSHVMQERVKLYDAEQQTDS